MISEEFSQSKTEEALTEAQRHGEGRKEKILGSIAYNVMQ